MTSFSLSRLPIELLLSFICSCTFEKIPCPLTFRIYHDALEFLSSHREKSCVLWQWFPFGYFSRVVHRVFPSSCCFVCLLSQDHALCIESLPNLISFKMNLQSFQHVRAEQLPNFTELAILIPEWMPDIEKSLWTVFEKCSNLKSLSLQCLSFRRAKLSPTHSLFSSNQLTHFSLSNLELSDRCLEMFGDLLCLHELMFANIRLDDASSWGILCAALTHTPLKIWQIRSPSIEIDAIWEITETINLDWLYINCSTIDVPSGSELTLKDLLKRIRDSPISAFHIRIGRSHHINRQLITVTETFCLAEDAIPSLTFLSNV